VHNAMKILILTSDKKYILQI